jgi:hypothetical protein
MIVFLAQDAPDAGSVFELAGALASASPPVMLAILIFALLRGWLILPRETEVQKARLAEVLAERDEYKDLAFRAVGIGERVARAAESNRGAV